MRKFQIAIVALLLIAITTSCRRGRYVVIRSSSDNNNTQIEYSGKVHFNTDSSRITGLSHNGFVNYTHNNDKLVIANDETGHMYYELNGEKTSQLNATGKQLLSEAIKLIGKSQGK